MKISKLFFFALAILALAACGRKTAGTVHSASSSASGSAAGVAVMAPAPRIANAYANLAAEYKPWTVAEMPITLQLLVPERLSISGKCTMVRDSLIYMSLRMLGFEVAVVQLTADSLKAVDKFNKVYVAESLKEVAASYPITIGNVQDLLMGHAFVPAGSAGIAGSVQEGELVFTDSRGIWACAMSDADIPALQGIALATGRDGVVECSYSGFAPSPAGPIASTVDLDAVIGLGDKDPLQAQARIGWRPDKAVWRLSRIPQYSQPRGCRKVSGVDILKTF